MALPERSLSLQIALVKNEFQAHRDVLKRHQVAKYLRHSLQNPAEMTVRIVQADEAQELNKSYRQKDYATNVLTFDYSQAPIVCADLVICAEVVEREAKEQGKTLQAHYAHLLVHGCLHAQGYDHELGQAEAEEMEALEIQIMQKLGFDNPY